MKIEQPERLVGNWRANNSDWQGVFSAPKARGCETLGSARAPACGLWRPRQRHPVDKQALGAQEVRVGGGADASTRGARAPQNSPPALFGDTGAKCVQTSGLKAPNNSHATHCARPTAWDASPTEALGRWPRLNAFKEIGNCANASIRRGARASCPHQPASCRRPGETARLRSTAQASGRMPEAAGWKPALPFDSLRVCIFGGALVRIFRYRGRRYFLTGIGPRLHCGRALGPEMRTFDGAASLALGLPANVRFIGNAAFSPSNASSRRQVP